MVNQPSVFELLRFYCIKVYFDKIRLRGRTRSSGPSLFVYGIRAFLPRCAPYIRMDAQTVDVAVLSLAAQSV